MRTGVLSDRSVIENCPVFKPVPMKDVDKLRSMQATQATHNYEGIKTVVHSVPARPATLHAMQVALDKASNPRVLAPNNMNRAKLPENIFMGRWAEPAAESERRGNRNRGRAPVPPRVRPGRREVWGAPMGQPRPVNDADQVREGPFNLINEFQYFGQRRRGQNRPREVDRRERVGENYPE